MPLQPLMADSVTPWDIPEKFAAPPNGVAVYRDGLYAWPPWALRTYPYQWGITVTGALDMAPHARVIDVEHLDADPADVEPYRIARAARAETTIVYCDRSTVPLVIQACPGWQRLRWWIATLDGEPWTPGLMVGWLKSEYTVTLDPAAIRAIQNMPMGDYDQSLIFGDPGWLHVAA
jgi:hypothetical protein